MENTYTIIERRSDGSFVIEKEVEGLGLVAFHAIPVMYQELWEAVCAQEGVDPVAQAEKYAASLLPPEPEVPDVE